MFKIYFINSDFIKIASHDMNTFHASLIESLKTFFKVLVRVLFRALIFLLNILDILKMFIFHDVFEL